MQLQANMWHGGATWGNNNDDDDDDVEFQDTTTTQKRKSHEIIEIPDSSDENASASEDEDVRQAEVKPSPAKKPKRKVSLPKCAATKAPRTSHHEWIVWRRPTRCCRAGLAASSRGPARRATPHVAVVDADAAPGRRHLRAADPRGVKPSRRLEGDLSRRAAPRHQVLDVRVDDGASLKRCTDARRPYGKYGTSTARPASTAP